MPADLHGDGLGNAGRDHVARRRAAEVVENLPWCIASDDAPGNRWRAQGDDFRTFLGELVQASPRAKIPAGLVRVIPDTSVLQLCQNRVTLISI